MTFVAMRSVRDEGKLDMHSGHGLNSCKGEGCRSQTVTYVCQALWTKDNQSHHSDKDCFRGAHTEE